MDIKNKTIIITGAARIGETVAETVLAAGANLVVAYRQNPPPIKESEKVLKIKAELTNQEQVASLIASAKKQFGAIHGLVHMAATYERVPWAKLDLAAWDRSMNDIAKSAFLVSKLVADEIINNSEEVKGKIILISDWSVLNQPYKDYLAYNSAKSAVVGLTKSLAAELAPGVLVNCIAPGPILRPPDLSEEDNAEVMAKTPLARWGGADEIAKGIKYLLDADFVTGQILYIDGGRSNS